jgi:hypothetical protein
MNCLKIRRQGSIVLPLFAMLLLLETLAMPASASPFILHVTVFGDKDGTRSYQGFNGLEGWTVNLEQPAGNVIQTAKTDKLGWVDFQLERGKDDYTVTVVPQSGWKLEGVGELFTARLSQSAGYVSTEEDVSGMNMEFGPFVPENPASTLLPAYTCKAPSPITNEQIDKYLDFLGSMLQVAYEEASPMSLDPLYLKRRGSPSELTWKDAADLGRAVWDQSRGLQRAALAGDLTLSFSQVQRTKAFGLWADWLEKRAERGLLFAQPEPPYPFIGPINEQVPTPPQLKGEESSDIYWEEYSWATAKTIFQGADLYYTRGLIWPLYLSVRDQSLRPVIMAAIPQIKYGPAIIGAYLGYIEYNEYDSLTWDQHMQNVVGIYTSALATGLQLYRQPTKEVNFEQPISEGSSKPLIKTISEIAKEHPEYEYTPGKSFLIKRKLSEGGKDYAELEVGSVGSHKGRAEGETGPETRSVEVEVVKEGNNEAYFLKTDGSRIIPIGEKGYHAWKHIFERLYGYDTGYPSLLETFEGTKYEARLEKMASEINDRTNIDLDPVNAQYKSFVEDLKNDPSYPKFSSYDSRFGPREVNYILKIPSKCMDRTYYGRISIADAQNSGQLMNFFLQDSFTKTNLPKALADPVFDWMAIPSGSPLYSPALKNYVPEYVLQGM